MSTAAITQPNFNLDRPPLPLARIPHPRPRPPALPHPLPPALLNQNNALVLGDGDGRFLAHLLAANPHLHADAVDTSGTMLNLLEARNAARTPHASTPTTPTPSPSPQPSPYDLIVTHFFLDCLTQPELEALIHRLTPALGPNALWLVSDFRIPDRPHAPARPTPRPQPLPRLPHPHRPPHHPPPRPRRPPHRRRLHPHRRAPLPRRPPHHRTLATHSARVHSNHQSPCRPQHPKPDVIPSSLPGDDPIPPRATRPLARRARPRRLPPRTGSPHQTDPSSNQKSPGNPLQ